MSITIFKRSEDLIHHVNEEKKKGCSIGFVPTMGALHQGHISLIEASAIQCDVTVCSIFVNPTQFNDKKDLETYPRNLGSDIKVLMDSSCDILFAPDVHEIYPHESGFVPSPELSWAGKVMEAAHRPGHYDGVMQVVYRLLDIVKPDVLFMGQKDYQQQLIIRQMIAAYEIKTKLVMVPTEREADGMALSSRNVKLDEESRIKATILSKTLHDIKSQLPHEDVNSLLEKGINQIADKGLEVEYLQVADQNTLKPLSKAHKGEKVVICVAARAGDVRLIDNVLYPD